MNCKYCNAEMAEEEKICPACGKEQEETAAEIAEEVNTEEVAATEEIAAAEEAAVEEQPEAPAKASTKKITAAVIAVVLVAAILIGLVAGGLGGKNTNPAGDATLTATEPLVISSDGDPSSPQCKASYTVSDEEAIASADVVVATMGDKKLTNRQLQLMYWQELLTILNEYGNVAIGMGLDVYSPLDAQPMTKSEPIISWQQFVLEGAVSTWQTSQALAMEAEANGFQMPADMQEQLDEMPVAIETNAVDGGFENAEAMIKAYMGTACTLEDYLELARADLYGRAYYIDCVSNLNPSDAEVEAFFAENEDYFKENGITKDTRFVNVRHVLLQPEGGEAGEDGYPVYTDEAWEACRVKVEEIYTKWQEGDKSEDSFAQLAMNHSVDSSAANGGLYENVYVGQMVEEFENWCFDESRVAGDHGLVKTRYGYHIMFFSAHRGWMDLAREGMIDSLAYDLLPNITEKYTAQVDYSLVSLSHINFG